MMVVGLFVFSDSHIFFRSAWLHDTGLYERGSGQNCRPSKSETSPLRTAVAGSRKTRYALGMRPGYFIAGLALAVFAAAVLLIVAVAREPSYRGRTLSGWLEEFSVAPLDESERRSEAEQAIRAM